MPGPDAREQTTVRLAVESDRDRLIAAIADQQDYEGALHDTRRPGAEIAEAYLAEIHDLSAANHGAIFVAEISGEFAGYAAGWVAQETIIEETPDSNRYGYVSDAYVVPDRRGQGVVGPLLQALEAHLRETGVTRLRIGALANNASALRAYRKHGFEPYEAVLEKKLRPPGEDAPTT